MFQTPNRKRTRASPSSPTVTSTRELLLSSPRSPKRARGSPRSSPTRQKNASLTSEGARHLQVLYHASRIQEYLDPVFTGSFAVYLHLAALNMPEKHEIKPNDLDVVIEGESLPVVALADLGFHPKPGYDPIERKGVVFTHQDGFTIDVILARRLSTSAKVMRHKMVFTVLPAQKLLSYYKDAEEDLKGPKKMEAQKKIRLLDAAITYASNLM